MRFHSGQYQFRVPFVIYSEFQAIFQSSEDEIELNSETPYMREINHYIPSGFCTYATFVYELSWVEDLLRLYKRKDCMEVFCNHIEEEAKRLYHMFPQKPMESLMPEQWGEFIRMSNALNNSWDEKVRHHCHYTGNTEVPLIKSATFNTQFPTTSSSSSTT